ncbi:Peroxin-2 [Balamuthia mandrillaris]
MTEGRNAVEEPSQEAATPSAHGGGLMPSQHEEPVTATFDQPSLTLDRPQQHTTTAEDGEEGAGATPPPWEREWQAVAPSLENMAHNRASSSTLFGWWRPTLRILRVNQVDAAQLDSELFSLLKAQFMNIFSLWRPSVVDKVQPELDAVLAFMMYRLSIYISGATYGQKLQNLVYRNENAIYPHLPTQSAVPPTGLQKVLWGILHIGGRWGWQRLNRLCMHQRWAERGETDPRRRAWLLLNHLETAWKLFSLLNFIVFLYDGKYLSLIDRLLRMRLVYSRRGVAHYVNFEFMNRQLVWHGFTEFLLFLMPLINVEKLKSSFSRLLSLRRRYRSQNNSPEETINNSSCPICQAKPANTPYRSSPCGHVFCYYCIKTALMTDGGRYLCPRCGETITSIERYYFHSSSPSPSPPLPQETKNKEES